MAERLCQAIVHFLAEPDGQIATGLARVRIAASLAEGLDSGDAGLGGHAAAADDPGCLADFLDHGLPQSEWSAMVATLAHDPVRRAEASSAAAFLDGIEDAHTPAPAGLIARAVRTFEHEASPEQGKTVGRGQWSRLWPSRRVMLPSFAVLVLVAVVTPAVLPLIWDERNASVPDDDDSIRRSIAPPPGTNKNRRLDGSTAEPAPTSCEPATKEARGDQRAVEASKVFRKATEPMGSELMKPQGPVGEQSSGASAGNPCPPKPSIGDDLAPAGLPAGARN